MANRALRLLSKSGLGTARCQFEWAGRMRGLWLGPLAFLASSLGVALLGREATRTAGVLWLVGAGALAILAWGRQPWISAFCGFTEPGGSVRSKTRRRACLVGVGAGLLMGWLADARYLAQPDETFGPAGWLWLAGMSVLTGSTFFWPNASYGEERTSQVAAGTAVPLGPVPPTEDTAQQARPTRRLDGAPPAWTAWEVALFCGIVVLAVGSRVWNLASFPYAIHPDEILTGRTAMQAYFSPTPPSVFRTVWNVINLPALWFALVALSLKIWGTTLAAVRLPAALFGAATVMPFYGLVRGVWGRAAAITGATILALSASNVHYSRVTLNNIVTPFFWTTSFFFLLRGLRMRRPVDWVLAGLAAGLSEYSYYGTRLLPLLMLTFLGYLLAVHWQQARRYIGYFGLLVVGYVIGFGPLLPHFARHPELYSGRGAGVLTWNHLPDSWEDSQRMWSTLSPLIGTNLLGISTRPSEDGVYWAPLLLPAEAALLAVGAALLVWRWRHPAAFLVLLSGLGVLFVGGTLVHGVPYLAHWTPAFPAFYAALAAPIGAWASVSQGLPVGVRRTGITALATGLAVLAWLNLDFYFSRYYAPRPEAEIRTAQSRYAAALGPDYRVRNVGRTWQPYDPETSAYLVNGQDGAQIYNPGSELPLPGASGKGLAFFFFPDNEQYRAPVRELYPGGSDEEVVSHNGTHLFFSYLLTPPKAQTAYGVYLELSDPRGFPPRWSGQVPAVGSLPHDATYPTKARWSGALYLPGTTSYTVRLDRTQASAVFDGRPDNLPTRQPLLAGWHHFVVEADLASSSTPRLMLGSGGAEPTEVTTLHLWPVRPGQGLVHAIAAGGGAPVVSVDLFIGFTGSEPPGLALPGQDPQSLVRASWAGELEVPRDGSYTLEIRTTGQARLLVDGQSAVEACSDADAVQAQTRRELTAGRHELVLDYVSQPGSPLLELYWTPPDGGRSLIPSTALRYASDPDLGRTPLPRPPDAVTCTSL